MVKIIKNGKLNFLEVFIISSIMQIKTFYDNDNDAKLVSNEDHYFPYKDFIIINSINNLRDLNLPGFFKISVVLLRKKP